jgi:hypothetical protein
MFLKNDRISGLTAELGNGVLCHILVHERFTKQSYATYTSHKLENGHLSKLAEIDNFIEIASYCLLVSAEPGHF